MFLIRSKTKKYLLDQVTQHHAPHIDLNIFNKQNKPGNNHHNNKHCGCKDWFLYTYFFLIDEGTSKRQPLFFTRVRV